MEKQLWTHGTLRRIDAQWAKKKHKESLTQK